jgi:hypothetical protein
MQEYFDLLTRLRGHFQNDHRRFQLPEGNGIQAKQGTVSHELNQGLERAPANLSSRISELLSKSAQFQIALLDGAFSNRDNEQSH